MFKKLATNIGSGFGPSKPLPLIRCYGYPSAVHLSLSSRDATAKTRFLRTNPKGQFLAGPWDSLRVFCATRGVLPLRNQKIVFPRPHAGRDGLVPGSYMSSLFQIHLCHFYSSNSFPSYRLFSTRGSHVRANEGDRARARLGACPPSN